MNTFTINKIYPNGSVDVTFSIDNKMHNISGAPVSDADALTAYLNDWAIAYEAGLAVQTVDVPTEVHDLVGKAQAVEVPVDPAPLDQTPDAVTP